MFLEKSLQKLGLTEKQAKVYLATLELGVDSVGNIAKKAEIKRPTTYLIVEELLQKGLVSKAPKNQGNKYVAENPENFKNILEQSKKNLDYAMPFLKTIYNVDKDKPQVRIYEGIEGIKQVYYNTIWKAKSEILFFSSINKLYKEVPELLEEWLEYAKNNNINTREIVDEDSVDLKYAKRMIKENLNITTKILPKELNVGFKNSDNAIFDDKIMFVSFKDKLFTTVIESQVLADSMRALYELAWNSATPIKKYLK